MNLKTAWKNVAANTQNLYFDEMQKLILETFQVRALQRWNFELFIELSEYDLFPKLDFCHCSDRN